jgi:Fic family protein
MQESAEKEARKALVRLRRALEKSRRELDALAGAIRLAEGEDFPFDAYARIRLRLGEVQDFLEEEGHRLEAKILLSGGLEPGRIRRSSDTPPG